QPSRHRYEWSGRGWRRSWCGRWRSARLARRLLRLPRGRSGSAASSAAPTATASASSASRRLNRSVVAARGQLGDHAVAPRGLPLPSLPVGAAPPATRRVKAATWAGPFGGSLVFDDDGRSELDAIVDPDDVRVPHAYAAMADGATEKLWVWRSMDPDRPPVTVREAYPALAERIRRPRWNHLEDARRDRPVDLVELRVHYHLLHLVLPDR